MLQTFVGGSILRFWFNFPIQKQYVILKIHLNHQRLMPHGLSKAWVAWFSY